MEIEKYKQKFLESESTFTMRSFFKRPAEGTDFISDAGVVSGSFFAGTIEDWDINEHRYFNSDEWKKLSKREKASWKMRFDGKIAYYDSDEVILEKFSPHPMKLEYGSFNERVYWSRMSNMISRKDGSFYIVLSSSDYTATLEGTCSVIEDSDRLF